MKSLAKQNEPAHPVMEYGWITHDEPGYYGVETPLGTIKAVRAVTCLVAPRPGDRVLISFDDGDCGFILAILQRDTQAGDSTDLVFDGQVNLHAQNGGLSLTTDQNLVLGAREELSCASKQLKVHAHDGRAAMDKLSFAGRILETQFERIKSVAQSVEHVFSELTQRLTNAFRFVEEHDELQAGSTRTLVEDTMTTHSKNAVHMAEEIIKLNAEQVHLG